MTLLGIVLFAIVQIAATLELLSLNKRLHNLEDDHARLARAHFELLREVDVLRAGAVHRGEHGS